MALDFEERPWGSWHVIDVDRGYKVKRIHVKPGARLSYQTHEHRSEHWVVISGTATCVVEGETVVAEAGHSVDVALGAAHRITNAHDVELVIRCAAPVATSIDSPGRRTTVSPSSTHVAVPKMTTQCSDRCSWVW